MFEACCGLKGSIHPSPEHGADLTEVTCVLACEDGRDGRSSAQRVKANQCAGEGRVVCVREHVFICKYVWARSCTQSTVCLPVTQVCVCTAGIYITNSTAELSWERRETSEPLLLWNNGGCIHLTIDSNARDVPMLSRNN